MAGSLMTPAWFANEAAQAFLAARDAVGKETWFFEGDELYVGNDTVILMAGRPKAESFVQHTAGILAPLDVFFCCVGSELGDQMRQRINAAAGALAKRVLVEGTVLIAEMPMGPIDFCTRATSKNLGVSVRLTRELREKDQELRFDILGARP